jgi:hypothetical protein
MGTLRVTKEQIEAEFPGLKICCDDISLAALVDLIGINKTLIIADECYNSLKIPAKFALACARRVQDDKSKKILDDIEELFNFENANWFDWDKLNSKYKPWCIDYTREVFDTMTIRRGAVSAIKTRLLCINASNDYILDEMAWQEDDLTRIIESSATNKRGSTMKYKIRPGTPETVIYLDFGCGLLLDYSRFPSKSAVWLHCAENEPWVRKSLLLIGCNKRPEIQDIFIDHLHEFTREDVLAAAQAGETWPVLLGYVEPI